MRDLRVNAFAILKQENKMETLLCYPGHESIEDLIEQTTTVVYMNPLPVKAIVRQLSQESLRWKYYGTASTGSIEIVAELKDETIFKTAAKIEYNGQIYHTMKDDSQNFLIMKRQDYIVVVLGRKND